MPGREGAAPVPPSSFDSVIMAAVVVECQDLVGARVQRVHSLGPDGLALSLRLGGRTWALAASIHPRWGRVCLAEQVVPSDATPFATLLRSRLDGATLVAIDAPLFERTMTCTFETLEGPALLHIEITGRHANLILSADDVIVGALKMIGPDRSRVREVLPGRPYAPPPRPARPDPAAITAQALRTAAQAETAAAQPAWRTVFETVSGIGPATAREMCARAGIDAGGPMPPEAADAVADALQGLAGTVQARRFAPLLYRDADGLPVAYGAFPMEIYAALHAEPTTMTAAVEVVTSQGLAQARMETTRQSLASLVAGALQRIRRALAAVDEDARRAAGADRLREHGELILAYLNQIRPGASALEVPGFDGQPTVIALNPARSGVENAQSYFRRYAKAQAALKRLPARRAALEAEQAFLEALATTIDLAEDEDTLWEIEQDLIAAGLRRRMPSAVRPKAAAGGRVFEVGDGYRVRVGRSARENDYLTFDVAGPNDLWLHARDTPGSHVILTGEGSQPPEAVIEAAARIAAYYSAGRGATRVPISVTRRRFVRRVRGGRPGHVTYTNERTLTVPPGLPRR